MKQIENWDSIDEAGEFKQLPKGIYPLVIKDATDVAERQYLSISLDIVKGDYKDYFKTIGLVHIRSYKDTALSFFKAFITAVEKSNSGYQWNWDESTLKNKYVMGVFGEEEYVAKDGSIKVRVALKEVRSVQAFKEGKIKVPELKKLTEEEINKRLQELNLSKPVESAPAEIDLDDLPF